MKVVIATGILLLFFYADAKAQTCTGASGLQSGQVAPCTGVLWSPADSVRAVECVSVDLPKCGADVVYHSTRSKVMLNHLTKIEGLCDGTINKLITIAEDAAGLRPEPWHRSPWLWLSIGVVVGGVSVYYIGTTWE